jgi:GNAT superfamily N-acetyltransferase
VLKEFRSQGIATEIIRKCENEALKRHCLLIGLGTHSNLASRDNLYIRSGYEPSTIDNYIDTYKTKLENGTVVTIRKEAQFLIKRIGD